MKTQTQTQPKRVTWSQVKRARVFLGETEKGEKICGAKSFAHKQRILRRQLSRLARQKAEGPK